MQSNAFCVQGYVKKNRKKLLLRVYNKPYTDQRIGIRKCLNGSAVSNVIGQKLMRPRHEI